MRAAEVQRQASTTQFSRQPSATSNMPDAMSRTASPLTHHHSAYAQHHTQHATAVQAAREAQVYHSQPAPTSSQPASAHRESRPLQQYEQQPAQPRHLNTEDLIRAMTESATQRARTSWAAYSEPRQHFHGALDVAAAPTFTTAAAPGWTTRSEPPVQPVQPPTTTGARPITQNPMNAPPAVLSPTYEQHQQQHQQQQLQLQQQQQLQIQHQHQVRRASTPNPTKTAAQAPSTTTVHYQAQQQPGAAVFTTPTSSGAVQGSAHGFGPAGAVVSITTRIVGNQKFTRRVERYPTADGSIRERVIEYVSNNTGTPYEGHLRAPVTGMPLPNAFVQPMIYT
jgi:hypothetical protein